MRIKQLGHIALVVSDPARSRDFYSRILGMEVSEDDPDHGGVFMTFGDQGHNLDLFTREILFGDEPSEDRSQRVHHFAFMIESEQALKDAYFALRDAGIEIVRAIDHETQYSIYLHDPEGNFIELYWEKPDALDVFRAGRGDVDRPLEFTR